jgi:hypothetical protein
MTGMALCVPLYFLCWLLVGLTLYPGIHPDFWGPTSVYLVWGLTLLLASLLAFWIVKALRKV